MHLRTNLLLLIIFLTLGEAHSWAQSPAITPAIEIDQRRLLQGDYSLRKVLESGRHLFSTPFTKLDGYGQGGALDENGVALPGPREIAFEENLLRLITELGFDPNEPSHAPQIQRLQDSLRFPFPGLNPETHQREIRFLRLNGLDSQSCFECHNSIGSANRSDTRSEALSRKVSVTGGPAGAASNAFINDELPYRTIKFIRNPPHVFGTGYAQALAEEMTFELLRLKFLAIGEAVANPNSRITTALESKGISFGTFAVTYKPNGNDPIDTFRMATASAVDDRFDYSGTELEGISVDLVVRPFQWKGNASNERNFVKDALKFHFGMLPVEIQESPDEDSDGVTNEVSVGNVSALTAYTMAIRPPTQIIDEGKQEIVAKGQQLFTSVQCAQCHALSLRLNESRVVIRDPDLVTENLAESPVSLTTPRKSSSDLPVMKKFRQIERNVKGIFNPQSDAGLKQLRTAAAEPTSMLAGRGFEFDLSMPPGLSLSFSYPRLPENGDGTIDVPLLSDLKRHKMGDRLSDKFDQGTDVGGIIVAKDEFLTRPLWGVADTGPWLHDGRALSLFDAIVLHQGNGSEANDSVSLFEALPDSDQGALIEFLLSLRLPNDPRYIADEKP